MLEYAGIVRHRQLELERDGEETREINFAFESFEKNLKAFDRKKFFWDGKSFNQYENLIAIIIRIERNEMNWSISDEKSSIASARDRRW